MRRVWWWSAGAQQAPISLHDICSVGPGDGVVQCGVVWCGVVWCGVVVLHDMWAPKICPAPHPYRATAPPSSVPSSPITSIPYKVECLV